MIEERTTEEEKIFNAWILKTGFWFYPFNGRWFMKGMFICIANSTDDLFLIFKNDLKPSEGENHE